MSEGTSATYREPRRGLAPDPAGTRARDRALGRVRRATRWVIALSLAAATVLSAALASAIPGRSHATSSSTSSASQGGTGGSVPGFPGFPGLSGGSGLQPPAVAPGSGSGPGAVTSGGS